MKATPFDPHYFFQAAWLARRMDKVMPPFDVDIGSSVMIINVLSASAKTIFFHLGLSESDFKFPSARRKEI